MTDDFRDLIGTFEYWWTLGLISDSTFKLLRKTCDLGSATHPSNECNKALILAEKEQGKIDPYSIFTPPCNETSSSSSSSTPRHRHHSRSHLVSLRIF